MSSPINLGHFDVEFQALLTCTPCLGHPAGGFSGFMDVPGFDLARGL